MEGVTGILMVAEESTLPTLLTLGSYVNVIT